MTICSSYYCDYYYYCLTEEELDNAFLRDHSMEERCGGGE